MLTNAESGKKSGGSVGNTKLLREIEAINRAINADKTVQRLASSTASSRSKKIDKLHQTQQRTVKQEVKQSSSGSDEKNKKSSIWSWRGLKALTHIRNLRFNCCFSLLVHSIEGLPTIFNDESLVVHWKRRDGNRMTCSVRVSGGVAKFEEQLNFSCSVYGSRSGPHHSAKYEAKHFLVYASIDNSPDLDLGKHRIDLTRLLPLTLEELEEEKGSGNWSTSFRLSGKASGAVLSVIFGYLVTGNNNNMYRNEPGYNNNVPKILASTVKFEETVDQRKKLSFSQGETDLPRSISNQSSEGVKDLHEILLMSRTEICDSTNDETSISSVEIELDIDYISSHMGLQNKNLAKEPDIHEEYSLDACGKTEFYAIDEAFDPSMIKQVSESLEIDPSCDGRIDQGSLESSRIVEVCDLNTEKSLSNSDCKEKEWDLTSKEQTMEDLEAALRYNLDLLEEGLDFQDEINISYVENHSGVEFDFEDHNKGKSLSAEDFSDSVAYDFLEMLGLDHSPYGNSESEPDSPRERLLREFEKDALASGGLFNLDTDDNPSGVLDEIPFESYWGANSEDFNHSSIFQSLYERPHMDSNVYDPKTRASEMAHIETDTLMRDWGINDEVFNDSPSTSCSGFGNSTETRFADPLELPPLGDGLGPFVQTNNGGFLRSLSPSLFKNSKIGGSLVMQASNPVVVPAEMGSNTSNILQGLASVGIEKLSMQAKKLMPLEEITGKTIQHFAWKDTRFVEGQDLRPQVSEIGQNLKHKSAKGISSVPLSKEDLKSLAKGTEYVSLEDLAPLAMDEIEALSIEGLRLQCGMSDEKESVNFSSQSVGELSAFKGHNELSSSLGHHGTCGVQLMNVDDNGEDIDGLMGLSLTLDEWMKLDSGEIDDDDLKNEHTSKILAAHHATSLDQFRGRSKGEKRQGRSKKCGLLGNEFTIALMVQLRDPLRDYEAVGLPMLALIQVERVFTPPKPKIYSTVSVFSDSSNDTEIQDDAKEKKVSEMREQDVVPQFTITEVHVAGLKVDDSKKLWDSKNQLQSSSRWLLANGMGKKTNKHPLMKSKMASKSPALSSAKSSDSLWSVGHRVNGSRELKGRK